MIELVVRNNPAEICRYLTQDGQEESLEVLEEANTLITPVMEFIRECKGTRLFRTG
jgi:hypothetical protein